jgi:hypothetical protein
MAASTMSAQKVDGSVALIVMLSGLVDGSGPVAFRA